MEHSNSMRMLALLFALLLIALSAVPAAAVTPAYGFRAPDASYQKTGAEGIETPTVVAKYTEASGGSDPCVTVDISIHGFNASKEVDFVLYYDSDVLEPSVASEQPWFVWGVYDSVPGRMFFRVYQEGDRNFGNLLVTHYIFNIKGEGDFGLYLLPGIWVDEHGAVRNAEAELFCGDEPLPPRENEPDPDAPAEMRAIFVTVIPGEKTGRDYSYPASDFGVENLTKKQSTSTFRVQTDAGVRDILRFTPKTQADAKKLYETFLSHPGVERVVAEGWLEDSIFFVGDPDGDGYVSAADARSALRIAVGLDREETLAQAAADADLDGEVTAGDARMILRAAVGLEKLGQIR